MPDRNGFINSFNAPPFLLSTIPVRNFTKRIFIDVIGSILSSQSLQVSPKKSSLALYVSLKIFVDEISGPYQPIAEALIIALTLCAFSFNDFIISSLLFVRLSTISFFLFLVQRLSATPAPAR